MYVSRVVFQNSKKLVIGTSSAVQRAAQIGIVRFAAIVVAGSANGPDFDDFLFVPISASSCQHIERSRRLDR